MSKVLKLVEDLNEDTGDVSFIYTTTGYYEQIEFGGCLGDINFKIMLWDSENFGEANKTKIYESLYKFIGDFSKLVEDNEPIEISRNRKINVLLKSKQEE